MVYNFLKQKSTNLQEMVEFNKAVKGSTQKAGLNRSVFTKTSGIWNLLPAFTKSLHAQMKRILRWSSIVFWFKNHSPLSRITRYSLHQYQRRK
jgi:hypothetical protein